MLKQQIRQSFGIVKGITSVLEEVSSITATVTTMHKKLDIDTEFYKLTDKERLHNDYRKSTLPIKEEIDKFERYAR